MNAFSILWGMLVLQLLITLAQGAVPQNQKKKKKKKDSKKEVEKIPVKFHEDHRLIQWCVNGVDEPEFKVYPWNEFSPILQRRYTEYFSANVRFKYSIDLRPTELKLTGSRNYQPNLSPAGLANLLQRVHFVFKAQKRKEFRYNVKTSFNESIIEGLLVQVNFAPRGVGLPAVAQFVHPKDFNCVDCEKPIGIPIACRKRTYFHTLHPTILAYHHRFMVPAEEKERRRRYCVNKQIPKQCILTSTFINNPDVDLESNTTKTLDWPNSKLKELIGKPLKEGARTCQKDSDCLPNFKAWFTSECCKFPSGEYCNHRVEGNGTGNATADNSTEATPAPKVLSEYCPNKEWSDNDTLYQDILRQSTELPTFECKPATVAVCRPPDFTKTASVPWETREMLNVDYTQAKTPMVVDPFDPKTECCLGQRPGDKACPPGEGGQPIAGKLCPADTPGKTVCISRVLLPWDNKTGELPEPDTSQCDALGTLKYFTDSSEVHGNMVWYAPPCNFMGTETRVRFQLLVVHSFTKGVYSIVESEDYYDLKSTGFKKSEEFNRHIPSPLFTDFNHECERPSQSLDSLYTKSYQRVPYDYSRSYDQCVQEVFDNVNHQICPGVPHFTPEQPVPGRRRRNNVKSSARAPKCDALQVLALPVAECADLCPQLASTTEFMETSTDWNPIKRSLHGAINIITNFCIMPICVFIARFYKETYNLQIFKGQRTWFWMHMIGSGGSTVLMYLGYFTSKLVDIHDPHVLYGHFYIIFLGMSYVTAWMRHKKRWVSAIMEILHSTGGYGCLILAMFCVNNAKRNEVPISTAVKFVVYCAISSLTVFYLGMTIHICTMDKKFGMKPRRWHFPIVESRFEDLPVPGRRVRQFFLFALLFVNLPLTIATLFL